MFWGILYQRYSHSIPQRNASQEAQERGTSEISSCFGTLREALNLVHKNATANVTAETVMKQQSGMGS